MWLARIVDRGHDAAHRLLHDRVLLVEVDEAAGDDLRLPDDRARLLVDRDDDHEHAVVGQGPPVAQDDLADVAHGQTVDVDVAGGDGRAAPRRAVGEDLDRHPVLDDEDVLRGDPGLDRQAPVLDLHAELAVHRDEVARLGQAEHQLQLFLAGVPGDVGALDRVVEDVRAGLEEVVDGPGDVFLVARDGAGRDDHRVARLDLDEAVVAVGHPGEAGHRLALGAGGADDELVGGDVADPVLGHDPVGVVGQVAEVARDPEVLLHGATDDGHLPVEAGGCVEDLLDAGDVAGEGRHDDPAVERLHDLAERFADGPLGRRVARVLGPRRVRQEADTPSSPSLARMWKSDSLPSTGVWSNLKSPVWTTVPTGVRRAMPIASGMECPIRKGTTVNGPIVQLVAGLEPDERVVVELVLLDLVAQEAAREDGGVDGHAGELREHVGQGSDVILVGMGDQERPDVGAALLEVADVGDDEVDAVHLLVGEHQAAVDHDDVVAVLEDVHVLADLPHPAERDDAERRVVGGGAGSASWGHRKRVSWSSAGGSGVGWSVAGRVADAGGATIRARRRARRRARWWRRLARRARASSSTAGTRPMSA